MDKVEKKEYEKPEVICARDIEAITGVCDSTGGNTGMDKLSFDPAGGVCMNPMT